MGVATTTKAATRRTSSPPSWGTAPVTTGTTTTPPGTRTPRAPWGTIKLFLVKTTTLDHPSVNLSNFNPTQLTISMYIPKIKPPLHRALLRDKIKLRNETSYESISYPIIQNSSVSLSSDDSFRYSRIRSHQRSHRRSNNSIIIIITSILTQSIYHNKTLSRKQGSLRAL